MYTHLENFTVMALSGINFLFVAYILDEYLNFTGFPAFLTCLFLGPILAVTEVTIYHKM